MDSSSSIQRSLSSTQLTELSSTGASLGGRSVSQTSNSVTELVTNYKQHAQEQEAIAAKLKEVEGQIIVDLAAIQKITNRADPAPVPVFGGTTGFYAKQATIMGTATKALRGFLEFLPIVGKSWDGFHTMRNECRVSSRCKAIACFLKKPAISSPSSSSDERAPLLVKFPPLPDLKPQSTFSATVSEGVRRDVAAAFNRIKTEDKQLTQRITAYFELIANMQHYLIRFINSSGSLLSGVSTASMSIASYFQYNYVALWSLYAFGGSLASYGVLSVYQQLFPEKKPLNSQELEDVLKEVRSDKENGDLDYGRIKNDPIYGFLSLLLDLWTEQEDPEQGLGERRITNKQGPVYLALRLLGFKTSFIEKTLLCVKDSPKGSLVGIYKALHDAIEKDMGVQAKPL